MYSVIFPLHILLHVVYNRSDMALDYRAWLECAKAELSALQSRKDGIRQQMESLRLMENNIDRQINGLAQTVAGLAPLVPEEPIDFSFRSVLGLVGKAIVDVGITDRIRAILRAGTEQRFSAMEIRQELERTGWCIGDYANALATIYTTVKRLVSGGEVIEQQDADGKRYQWNSFAGALILLPQAASDGSMTVDNQPIRKKVGFRARERKRQKRHMRTTSVAQPDLPTN